MIMNFFKKVMTFFSAIWNAILWRRTEKRAKQQTKSAEEEKGEEQYDVKTVSESEKYFEDVPLHSLVTSDSVESGQNTHSFSKEEILLVPHIPTVAQTIIESPTANAVYETNITSSILSHLAIEEETCSRLSFFPEPLQDDLSLPEVPVASCAGKSDGLEVDQSSQPELESEAPDCKNEENPGDSCNQVVSGAPQSWGSDPISNEVSQDHNAATEFIQEETTTVSTPEKTPVTLLEDWMSVEKRLTKEGEEASSDATHQIPDADESTCEMDPNSKNSAIGHDLHLFDHDDAVDDFSLKEVVESEHFDEASSNKIAAEDTKCNDASNCVSTMEAEESPAKIKQDPTLLLTEVAQIGISVSSTQHLVDKSDEQPEDTMGKYSTNYMVKSDSLVNFLPEMENEPAVNCQDEPSVALEAPHNSVIEDKEMAIGSRMLPLKEGCMEEHMCTPRGIIQLSGDHHLDDTDDEINTVTITKTEQTDIKDSVDDFLMDVFSFEEPLLGTNHIEGCVLEDTTLPYDVSSSCPPLRVITSFNAGLDDTDPVGNSELVIADEAIGKINLNNRCRSNANGNYTGSPNMPGQRISPVNSKAPRLNDPEDERKSPCRLSQFTTFHADDEDTYNQGQFQCDDILTPDLTTMGFGAEEPTKTDTSNFSCSGRDSISSVAQNESKSSRFSIDPINSTGFLDAMWHHVTLPFPERDGVTVASHQDCTSVLINKPECPLVGINAKPCNELPVEEIPESQVSKDLNEFYPFIDCSSYLFRIPEEIRKEASFNPCVGAAPSRRSGTAKNNNEETVRYNDDCDGYVRKYPLLNPLVSPCIPEAYRNSGVAKTSEGVEYNQIPLSPSSYWGTHPDLQVHGDQQHVMGHYPMSCPEDEDLDGLSPVPYGDENLCSNPEGYGYVNPYGTVEFPVLNLPLCAPQPHSGFVTRGPLAPLIFPIGPMSPNEIHGPILMNVGSTSQNDQQYPMNSTFWGGYQPNHTHDFHNEEDDDKGMASVIDMGGSPQIENLSNGTNDDEDDSESNQMPDTYFHLAENTSLHTVKSKADSYTGSLFCESLRSIISHNTDNENIFPSFSGSSVQGFCPSIVLQSCETTLSNDSLPSIIVEETNYTKSVDEDYLATEKFMNDVNTALNESVMEQIQGRVDHLQRNLLGRGDGSMSVEPGQGERLNQIEAMENEVMLRKSLGGSVSINNSKLTLLDGIVSTESEGSQPEPPCVLRSDFEYGSTNGLYDYCREVLESLLEEVLMTSDQQFNEAASGNGKSENGENPKEERIIVQHMMIVDSPTDLLMHETRMASHHWNCKPENLVSYKKSQSTDTVESFAAVSSHAMESQSNHGSLFPDNADNLVVDGSLMKRGRKNRRRRKKQSMNEVDLCGEETERGIGDGIDAPIFQCDSKDPKQPIEGKLEESCPSTSQMTDKLIEAGGEQVTSDIHENQAAKCYEEDAQDETENQEEEGPTQEERAGEHNLANSSSNNRKRRNRRKKRKN